jgi:hypothetical protein
MGHQIPTFARRRVLAPPSGCYVFIAPFFPGRPEISHQKSKTVIAGHEAELPKKRSGMPPPRFAKVRLRGPFS